MNTFLVSYDLRQPARDYTSLHAHLKSYDNWAKPLESVWLIKTGLEYTAVRDAVRAHVDADDAVLVIDVTSQPSAWHNLTERIATWIKTHL